MNAERAYEEWCGENRHVNDCHPVHDSSEAIEFAEIYARQKAVEFALHEFTHNNTVLDDRGQIEKWYDEFNKQ